MPFFILLLLIVQSTSALSQNDIYWASKLEILDSTINSQQLSGDDLVEFFIQFNDSTNKASNLEALLLLKYFESKYQKSIANCSPCTRAYFYAKSGRVTGDTHPAHTINYYQKATDLTEANNCFERFKPYTAMLINYGGRLTRQGDYEAAKKILRYAQKISKENNDTRREIRSSIEIATALWEDSIHLSLELLKKSISNIPKYNFDAALLLAEYSLEAKEVDSAMAWIGYAAQFSGFVRPSKIDDSKLILAEALLAKQNYSQAKEILIDILERDPPWQTYHVLSETYLKLNKVDSAILTLGKGIYKHSQKNWDQNLHQFSAPYIPQSTAEFWLIVDLASIYASNNYKLSLRLYLTAFDALDQIRINHSSPMSVRSRSDRLKAVFSDALELTWKIQSNENKEELALTAYRIIEKSRSFDLKNEKNTQNLWTNLDEEKLSWLTSFCQKLTPEFCSQLHISSKIDSLDTARSNAILLNEQSTLDVYLSSIQKGQLLLQYFWHGENVYLFSKGKQLLFEKLSIDHQLLKRFNEASSELYPSTDWESEFIKLSVSNYQQLIPLAEDLSSYKNITVLPDGPLYSTPFELLIPEEDTPNWEVDILLRQSAISYAYSCSQITAQISLSDMTFLGVAPFHQDAPKGYAVLSGSANEVNQLSKNFKRKNILLSDKATVSNLIQTIPAADITFISTHGDKNELASRQDTYLLLNGKNALPEKLSGKEIREIAPLSNITVLNACLSGTGEISTSEGLESLGYDCLFAGSKVVLVGNNYLATDGTGEIIQQTFEHWLDGKSFPSALKLSKLNYLDNQKDPILRHPAYWNNLFLYGNPHIAASTNNRWTLLLIFLPVGLLIFLLLNRFRASKAT